MEMTLGRRIAELRRKCNLTQEDLANLLSITPQAVSKWENDVACPDITLLPELAKILNISIDELLSGKKEEMPVFVDEVIDTKDLILKILVEDNKGDKVKINIPFTLIELALETGNELPMINGNSHVSSIDFKKIVEMVKQGVIGNLLDIETNDGTLVKIFVE